MICPSGQIARPPVGVDRHTAQALAPIPVRALIGRSSRSCQSTTLGCAAFAPLHAVSTTANCPRRKMYYPTSLVRRFWSTRKRNEIRVFGATPRAVVFKSFGLLWVANAMRHAMQRGFRNGTESSPPAGLVLWQDAAVNHEKNESARSQRRRPSHCVSHDRFPYRTSIAVSVCGSCVRCVSAIRLFVEYRRRLPASMAGMLRWLESPEGPAAGKNRITPPVSWRQVSRR